MKTSLLLTLLPFITPLVSASKLHPLTLGPSLSHNPLQARQAYCPSREDTVCDNSYCVPVCCGYGDGSGCRVGFYCSTTDSGSRGCCQNGEDCSNEGPPTCISRSNPKCTQHRDCCSVESPYCILSQGSVVCSPDRGTPADREIVGDGGGDEEEDENEDEDVPAVTTKKTPAPTTPPSDETDDVFPTTPTKKPSPTEETSHDDDTEEVVPTPTKKPSSGAGADAEETPESGSEGGILDRITSKAADLAKSAATDAINEALGGATEETKGESAAVRQVVGMGVAVGLGAVFGGMVLM